ncbi:MAG: hypothetical protein ACREVV_13645 [Steroidobacteraceae bacterium]
MTDGEQAFVAALRRAVTSGHGAWVARHVSFPLPVHTGTKTTTIRTREQFVAQYESIFNARVKAALELQSPNQLFKTSSGVMIGNGEVWFTATNPDPKNLGRVAYYIVAINNGASPQGPFLIPGVRIARIVERYVATHYQSFESLKYEMVVREDADTLVVFYKLPDGVIGGTPTVVLRKNSLEIMRAYRTQ